jgi:hypothetical protein
VAIAAPQPPVREPRYRGAPPFPTPLSPLSTPSQVLTFEAYFKEAVVESPTEAFRIRRVVFKYYVEDDTCQVQEFKVGLASTPCKPSRAPARPLHVAVARWAARAVRSSPRRPGCCV